MAENEQDQELADLLLDRQKYCKQLELEVYELKSSLKMIRLGVKDWQDKYVQLHTRVYFPEQQRGGAPKLVGWRLLDMETQLFDSSPTVVMDLVTALNRLLAIDKATVRRWVLSPVFESDVSNPDMVNETDLEDGDVTV